MCSAHVIGIGRITFRGAWHNHLARANGYAYSCQRPDSFGSRSRWQPIQFIKKLWIQMRIDGQNDPDAAH